MNRLWVRLSFAFGIFVLLGPLLLGSIGLLATRPDTLVFFIRLELVAPGSLSDQLAQYYREQQSWLGVQELIQAYDLSLPRGPEGRLFSLTFLDEGQNVLYGGILNDDLNAGSEVRETQLPILVDGRTRGYLIVSQGYSGVGFVPSADSQTFLLRQVSTALVGLALVSAVLGLVGGVVMSRSLAAPLARLAETVRRFGKRDFKARAEVKGSTELREVARAFNEMAADLEQAEARRRSLLADVAHELRTPLSVLQGNLQALLDGVFALEKDEIARLMQQTDTLTRLVDDLRVLAQAEAHQLPLTRTAVDLSALTRDCTNTFRAVARERDVQLIVDVPDAPVQIEAEAGRIHQVLSNLIDNALKHTPAKGEVRVMVANERDSAVVTVRDSGSGIAAEHLPHIFDRFYRADRARSRDTGGSGLGLAIAKAFVELHGGTIEVHSAGVAGQGTRFTLRLPLHDSVV